VSYGSVDGVRRLLPKDQTITQNTIGTVADVTANGSSIAATLDIALAQGGYTSPATNTTMKAALGLLEDKENCYLVMTKRSGPIEKADETWWGKFHKEFLDTVELIRKGTWAAPPTSSTGSVAASVTMNAETDNDPATQAKVTIDYEW